ncbi:MAG: hypothetical protein ACKV2V_19950 [Blastocatellia bacterium]
MDNTSLIEQLRIIVAGLAPDEQRAVLHFAEFLVYRKNAGQNPPAPGADKPAVSADPWEAMIGSFADDPQWDEFEAELRRIREEANHS